MPPLQWFQRAKHLNHHLAHQLRALHQLPSAAAATTHTQTQTQTQSHRASASSATSSIAHLLDQGPQDAENVVVNGFIRSIRNQKQRSFASVGDGSSLEPLQALLTPEQAQRSDLTHPEPSSCPPPPSPYRSRC
jgi:uncharacterized membrane protein YccC